MFNRKKIAYQQKRIEELEHIILELRKENVFLSKKIEGDKKMFSEKQKELSRRERIISEMEKQLIDMHEKLNAVKADYENVLFDLIKLKTMYDKRMREEIDTIKKGE